MSAPFSTGEHSNPECSYIDLQPCPADYAMHEEKVGQHWWSGWPGAWCMKCHAGDPAEACLADCDCSCHDAFWQEAETNIAVQP